MKPIIKVVISSQDLLTGAGYYANVDNGGRISQDCFGVGGPVQLSRRADYSVRVMLDVAANSEDSVAVTREIGLRQNIPQAFLTKIVGRLAQVGLLRSYRGSAGGVRLAKPADQINLREIIEAVDGPFLVNQCVLRPQECGVLSRCPVYDVWGQVQREMIGILESVTLQELTEKLAALQSEL